MNPGPVRVGHPPRALWRASRPTGLTLITRSALSGARCRLAALSGATVVWMLVVRPPVGQGCDLQTVGSLGVKVKVSDVTN